MGVVELQIVTQFSKTPSRFGCFLREDHGFCLWPKIGMRVFGKTHGDLVAFAAWCGMETASATGFVWSKANGDASTVHVQICEKYKAIISAQGPESHSRSIFSSKIFPQNSSRRRGDNHAHRVATHIMSLCPFSSGWASFWHKLGRFIQTIELQAC